MCTRNIDVLQFYQKNFVSTTQRPSAKTSNAATLHCVGSLPGSSKFWSLRPERSPVHCCGSLRVRFLEYCCWSTFLDPGICSNLNVLRGFGNVTLQQQSQCYPSLCTSPSFIRTDGPGLGGMCNPGVIEKLVALTKWCRWLLHV